MHPFETASGSVTGRDHRLVGRGNQDGFAIVRSEECLAAVVTDGCSSGAYSEVGAKLGARLLARLLHTQMQQARPGPAMLERVRQDVLAHLRLLATAMGGSFTETVSDYFLFTALVAVIDRERTLCASIGDGLIAVNGNVIHLGPFPGNAPPYLAYGLVETSLVDLDPALLKFQIQADASAGEIDSLLIATDGGCDFAAAEEKRLPGREEMVGPISQFWNEDRFYHNADSVRRRLAIVNAETRSAQHGLLPDDTTLVVARRIKGGS